VFVLDVYTVEDIRKGPVGEGADFGPIHTSLRKGWRPRNDRDDKIDAHTLQITNSPLQAFWQGELIGPICGSAKR